MKVWTTQDLLKLVIELRALTPDENKWNAECLEGNKPRYIRWQRIIALFKAFEIYQDAGDASKKDSKNEMKAFLKGDFIKERSQGFEYPTIDPLILNEQANEFDTTMDSDVTRFFVQLLNYRLMLDTALRYNEGFAMVYSLGIRAYLSLTNDLNKEIEQKLEKINQLLFDIINPKKLTFTEDVLINKYGFPTDDIKQADIDSF